MSGWRVLLAVSGVVLVIFGAMLVILKITGTDGGNGIVATPTAFPALGGGFLTPQPSSTPATQGGRPNCQLDWYVYRDPDGHFSFCYPPVWSVVASAPGADLSAAVALLAPDSIDLLTMYWRPSSYFSSPDADRCAIAPAWENRRQTTLDVLGRKSIPACTGDETVSSAPPLLATLAEIPSADGGYVTLFWFQPQEAGDAAERDTLASVLNSVKLAE
jgi:hypothetical protein